jgi:hypothetical protein
MTNDEQRILNILRQLKQHKESGNTGGLFPGQIRSFDGFNEYDPRDRQKIGELFVELEREGFLSRDQSVRRSNGWEITGRGSYHLSHSGAAKKEPDASE